MNDKKKSTNQQTTKYSDAYEKILNLHFNKKMEGIAELEVKAKEEQKAMIDKLETFRNDAENSQGNMTIGGLLDYNKNAQKLLVDIETPKLQQMVINYLSLLIECAGSEEALKRFKGAPADFLREQVGFQLPKEIVNRNVILNCTDLRWPGLWLHFNKFHINVYSNDHEPVKIKDILFKEQFECSFTPGFLNGTPLKSRKPDPFSLTISNNEKDQKFKLIRGDKMPRKQQDALIKVGMEIPVYFLEAMQYRLMTAEIPVKPEDTVDINMVLFFPVLDVNTDPLGKYGFSDQEDAIVLTPCT